MEEVSSLSKIHEQKQKFIKSSQTGVESTSKHVASSSTGSTAKMTMEFDQLTCKSTLKLALLPCIGKICTF